MPTMPVTVTSTIRGVTRPMSSGENRPDAGAVAFDHQDAPGRLQKRRIAFNHRQILSSLGLSIASHGKQFHSK